MARGDWTDDGRVCVKVRKQRLELYIQNIPRMHAETIRSTGDPSQRKFLSLESTERGIASMSEVEKA